MDDNIKTGTGRYYTSRKSQSGTQVPAKFSINNEIDEAIKKLFKDKEQVIIETDGEKVWIRKLRN